METKPETKKGKNPSKKKKKDDKPAGIDLPWRDQQVGYWQRQQKKSSEASASEDNPTGVASNSELKPSLRMDLQTPKSRPSKAGSTGLINQNWRSTRNKNETRKGESSTEITGSTAASKSKSNFPTGNHSVRLGPPPPPPSSPWRLNVTIGTTIAPSPAVPNAPCSNVEVIKNKKTERQMKRKKPEKNLPNLVLTPPSAELLKGHMETEPAPSTHVPKPIPEVCLKSQTQIPAQTASSAPLIDKRVNSSNELKPNDKNQSIPDTQASVPACTEPPLSLEASSLPKIHQSKTSPPGNHAYSYVFIQQVTPEILQRLKVPTVDSTNPYSNMISDKPIYRELFQHMINDNSWSTKTTAITEDFKKLNLREQLTEFTSAQSLTQNEAYLRWQFISDLYFLLKQQRPQCEVYVFGSLITGLADESSDIDVFVDLLGNSDGKDSSKAEQAFNLPRQAFSSVEEILKKANCPHNPYQKFKIKLRAIRGCNVPIIKLVHHARINCDLSFLNRLSVQNTKLLRVYMNWDPKIFQFFALIRYWGKYHNLIGSSLIKNYVLALLGLVFLSEMGLVPPVSLLQSLAASERMKNGLKNNNEIDGWDASFCEDLELVKNAFQAKPFPGGDSDAQIVMKLALEFFNMYGNTDFRQVVMCPLVGKIVPKESFCPGKESQLPEDFKPYKDYIERNKGVKQAVFRTRGHLCVQDPFVLNLNVAKSAKIHVVLKFKTACGKVEGPVTSLLDLFIPIPPMLKVVEDEKHLKSLENTNILSSKIKSALVLSNTDIPPSKEVEAVRAMEWAMNFRLSNTFERVFLTEIFLHKKLRYQNWIRDKYWPVISTLWNRFVSKFCNVVLSSFLLKNKSQLLTEVPDERLDAKKLWLPMILTTSTEGLVFKPASETVDFKKKMAYAPNHPKPLVRYQKISVEVTYPFWKNRGAYIHDFTTELLKSSTDSVLKVPIMPKKRKIKEQLDKPEFLECINPLWLEGWTSEMVKLLHSEDFKSFTLDLYISYHYGGGVCRPHIHFLLEKSEENGADVDEKNVELAIRAINNSIRSSLEDYVMYRLADWIQSPPGKSTKTLNQAKKEEIWNNVLEKVKQSSKMEGNVNFDEEDEDPSSESDDEDDSEKEN